MDTPSLNRRDILKVSLAGTAAMALPYQAVLSAKSASELDTKRMPRPYVAAFTAPPVLAPYRSDDKPGNSYGAVPGTGVPIVGAAYTGTDYYKIEQKPTQVEFIKGIKTTMWGYNGLVPGPTIRVYQDSFVNTGQSRRVVMQQINNLPAKHPTMGYVPWTSTTCTARRPSRSSTATPATSPTRVSGRTTCTRTTARRGRSGTTTTASTTPPRTCTWAWPPSTTWSTSGSSATSASPGTTGRRPGWAGRSTVRK